MFSSIRPIGAPDGNGGSDNGFEPGWGFPNSTHDSINSISWTSESRFFWRNCLDLGRLIVEDVWVARVFLGFMRDWFCGMCVWAVVVGWVLQWGGDEDEKTF